MVHAIETQLISTTRATNAQGEYAKPPLRLDRCGMSTDRPMHHSLDVCHIL